MCFSCFVFRWVKLNYWYFALNALRAIIASELPTQYDGPVFNIIHDRNWYREAEKNVSGFWSPLVQPRTRFVFFSFGIKRCPIAAKIAGLIGILPCCLKWLFHIGVWIFARFVRPLLATILCVWEIYYGLFPITTYTCHIISLVGK